MPQRNGAVRVSVVIAAFNVRALIPRALESVRAQTFGDWEIVVVDDASVDGTAHVVEAAVRSDDRIRLIRQEQNQGPAAARNRGIAEARGEWVAVLDADDAWRPERLERLLALAEQTGSDFVVDNLIFFDDHLQEETGAGFDIGAHPIPFTPATIFGHHNPWDFGIIKPLMRRRLFVDGGIRYEERLRFGEDFLLHAELLFSGVRAAMTPAAYYLYTTPVGHLSRERAIGSRSKTSLTSLMWVSDVLTERYRAQITPEIARGIARCRQRTHRRWVAGEITRLRQMQDVPQLVAFLVSHPRGAFRYLLTSRTLGAKFRPQTREVPGRSSTPARNH